MQACRAHPLAAAARVQHLFARAAAAQRPLSSVIPSPHATIEARDDREKLAIGVFDNLWER